jgi:hypothetical protein
MFFNDLYEHQANYGATPGSTFLPGGKICRSRRPKQVRLIASQEYGLY